MRCPSYSILLKSPVACNHTITPSALSSRPRSVFHRLPIHTENSHAQSRLLNKHRCLQQEANWSEHSAQGMQLRTAAERVQSASTHRGGPVMHTEALPSHCSLTARTPSAHSFLQQLAQDPAQRLAFLTNPSTLQAGEQARAAASGPPF